MKRFNITVNGNCYDVTVDEINGNAPAVPTSAAPAPTPVQNKPAAPAAVASGGTPVKSPMPGTVLDIKVTNGQSVKKGDVVLILEAMKMENDIPAPCDGTVSQIHVTKGASVNSNDILVSIS